MSDEATLEGAENPAQDERSNMMEKIAASLEQEQPEAEEQAEVETVAEADEEEIEEEESKESENVADDEPEPEAEEEQITLKIDGQEVTRKRSEVEEAGRKALQKELAADKRLEEATRLLKEAQQQTQNQQPPAQAAAEDAQPSMTDAEIIEKIQYGEPEEAAKALNDYVTGRQQQAIQPDQVQTIVEQKLESKRIETQFVEEFNDLVNDPYLLSAVEQKANQLLNDGQPNTWETYQKAGEEIRQWFGGKKQESNLDAKRERKKKVTNISTAKGKKEAPQEDAPQTNQDIIAEMRAARYQN